ncbi:YdgA family protein [Pasteurella dagmatis]|uniref:DUF945 domain-containing protein n=1 Tax=Pasteurella dagmatis ATCC 43325 TaxID=667128 RepID=C9PPM0_9PAST|nr:YdgA family protein [Pasteurella dagmatis]EEX50321.1 hypothetical protein HMPREF0621_0944 [Pasteurella dagmatis ATCC 43325]SNV57087.1 putative GTP-binding protein [Pasteurella dagmatis]
MKKSSLTLGVIAVLSAAWVGASWYTGKNVEAEYKTYIDSANKQLETLKSAGVEAKFVNVKFERGIFSSNVTYDVELNIENESWKYPMEGKINHGPLPLDHLSQFNFAPVLLSSKDQLIKNADTQAWFDYAQGQNPFMSHVAIGYDRKFSGKVNMASIKFPFDVLEASWKGLDATFSNVDEKGAGDFDLVVNGLNAVAVNQLGKKNVIELNKLSLNSQLTTSEWEQIPVGSQKLVIDSFKLKGEQLENQEENFEYRDIVITANASKDGEFVNNKFDSKIKDIVFNGKSLGQLDINLMLNHLEGKTLNELLTLLSETGINDQVSSEKIASLARALLDKQPLLDINPISLTNESGKLTSDLKVEFANGNFDALTQGNVLSLFKQFAVNVDVNKSALAKFISISQQAANVPAQEADEYAKLYADSAMADLAQQGIFVDGETNSTLKLAIENGELKLNGQVIPEEQIIIALWQLFLGFGL